MRFSHTDGTVVDIPDTCPYCEIDTGMNHSMDCPCYPGFEWWSDVERDDSLLDDNLREFYRKRGLR